MKHRKPQFTTFPFTLINKLIRNLHSPTGNKNINGNSMEKLFSLGRKVDSINFMYASHILCPTSKAAFVQPATYRVWHRRSVCELRVKSFSFSPSETKNKVTFLFLAIRSVERVSCLVSSLMAVFLFAVISHISISK